MVPEEWVAGTILGRRWKLAKCFANRDIFGGITIRFRKLKVSKSIIEALSHNEHSPTYLGYRICCRVELGSMTPIACGACCLLYVSLNISAVMGHQAQYIFNYEKSRLELKRKIQENFNEVVTLILSVPS